MKLRYRLLFPLFALAALNPAHSDQTFICTHDRDQRIIRVIYGDQETRLPCEVQYEKADGVETLWQAQNLAGYCEEKALAFVEKQRGWGWDCSEQAAEEETTPTQEPAGEPPEVPAAAEEEPAEPSPAMNEYERHALFVNALSTVAPFKALLEEFYQNNGNFPQNLADIGLDASDMKNSSYIDDLSIQPGGKIYILGKPQLGDNTVILFSAKATLGGTNFEWDCTTTYSSSQKMRSCSHDAALQFPAGS